MRPEINNQIVVNRAAEAVDFMSSYFLEEPMQYVSRGNRPGITEAIDKLNGYMLEIGKETLDLELMFWVFLGGVGYRLTLPNPYEKGAPFEIFTLNPMTTWLVRSGDFRHKPMVAFIESRDENDDIIYNAYTDKMYFVIKNGEVITAKRYASYGHIPIVEYSINKAKMGIFEGQTSLIDGIDLLESNRIDGVEQFVQALMVFKNCDIDSKEFQELQAKGAIRIKSDSANPADVYYLNEQLDQSQVQTAIEDLDRKFREVVGLPSQSSENSSTSDTGKAVMLRGGWQIAESRANLAEGFFTQSENETLEIVLNICIISRDLELSVEEIDQKFSRRSFADLLTKAQVLTTMLASDKIAPQDAYAASGMFVDANAAYIRGMAWYKEYMTAEQTLEVVPA